MGKIEKVKELHRLNPAYNWIVLLFLGSWAGIGYLTLHVQSHWFRLPFYFTSGIILHALGIMMHEGVHSKLFKNRKLNRWLGFVCGVPSLLGISAYKAVHLPHHRYERGVEDPDEFENITGRPTLLKIILLGWFLMGAYFYGLLHIPITGMKLAKRAEKIKIMQEYILIILLLGLVFWLVPLRTLTEVFLIPLLFTAQLSQVRGLAEHIFTSGDNPLTASRTVTSNHLVSFFMCNLNYHLEHHIYPAVPWYNITKLHELLSEDFRKAGASVYSSYFLYLTDVLKALLLKTQNPYLKSAPPQGYYRHYMPVLAPSKMYNQQKNKEKEVRNV